MSGESKDEGSSVEEEEVEEDGGKTFLVTLRYFGGPFRSY